MKFLLILLFFTEVFITTEKATTKEEPHFLNKMCLLGFNSEMELAGKIPPKDMANFTCNCFIAEISLGYSIESAKAKCKEDASERFKL